MSVVSVGCVGMTPSGGLIAPGNAVGIPVGALEPVEGRGLAVVGSRRMLDGRYCDVRLSVPVATILVGPVVGNELSGTMPIEDVAAAVAVAEVAPIPGIKLLAVAPKVNPVVPEVPAEPKGDCVASGIALIEVAVPVILVTGPVAVMVPYPPEPDKLAVGEALGPVPVTIPLTPETGELGVDEESRVSVGDTPPPETGVTIWVPVPVSE